MSTRNASVIVVATVLLGGVGALIAAWAHTGWNLEKASQIGDAAGPLVGLLSLVAVGAALWSVQLQRDALAAQGEAARVERAAMEEQLALQRGALTRQDEELKQSYRALETQLTYQRMTALSAAYAPFLAATSWYIEAIIAYKDWLRTHADQDAAARRTARASLASARSEMERQIQAVHLVDFDIDRGTLRWELVRRRLFEPRIDTPALQSAWGPVIYCQAAELMAALCKLKDSLALEFGHPQDRSFEHVRISDDELAQARAQTRKAREEEDTQYLIANAHLRRRR